QLRLPHSADGEHNRSAARERRAAAAACAGSARTGRPKARSAREGESMSATIVSLPDQSTARIPKVNFLTKENGLLSWLLTGDHKRIAILYLISITFFFFIGGALA